MSKFFNILFIIIFSIAPCAKNSADRYKIAVPKFIPINSSFDISLITSPKDRSENYIKSADQLELYILPDERLYINKVELHSIYQTAQLSFSQSVLENYIGSVYKTVIDLSDSSFSPDTYFQILINMRSENTLNAVVKFYGVFKQNGKVLGYLVNNADSFLNFDNRLITTELKFYRPQRSAGRALQLGKKSIFEISPENIETNSLLVEFWIKLSAEDITFLRIKNKETGSIEFSLRTNEFQMLNLSSDQNTSVSIKPYFAAKKTWLHVSVHFLIDDNQVFFYCNGVIFSRYQVKSVIKPGALVFDFSNLENEKSYQIDLLRFIDLKNNIEAAFQNRSYLTFRVDSSTVLTRFRFDSNEEFTSPRDKVKTTYSGVQFVRSDAPIYARAPELNINILSSSYELEWNGGDFKQASAYILEKSLENSEYVTVYTVPADNSAEKKYSFIDKKDESSDIIYYRVKQINLDGSVVYSSQVKVGQGKTELFFLEQNYPNPFNPKTSILVELLVDSHLEIVVYNLAGKEIALLHDGFLTKGVHKFTFDAADLPSGIYLCKVSTPNYTQTRKMILTK
jgi:hypothetical protein